ncbi:hypothetical protein WDU94_012611 [Cyamophila willieti]
MDAAFLIGKNLPPVSAYLNIPEIICVARDTGADAIHPGYGFLSEREDFAKEVIGCGLEFIGPRPDVLKTLGDKNLARNAAVAAEVPIIPGSTETITEVEKVREFCSQFGFPVILKAAFGGGGRGMRKISNENEIDTAFERARSEALSAFGKDEMLVEKYIDRPRHIEVQILGDKHGDVVHLYERDCSLQRRYQKVIQVAPAQNLDYCVRNEITSLSVDLAKTIGYSNAGTVEFLLDEENNFYFIEVNPRLQVEHTLSEEITGTDIVKAQIKVAEGKTLAEMGMMQENIEATGCAIQCHLRTEDPQRNFLPTTGKLEIFEAPDGPGIRFDSSGPYPGLVISPDYDSLLGKIIVYSPNYENSCEKMKRALNETKVCGVITNLPFLLNVFENPKFLSGNALETSFIDDHPELLTREPREDDCLNQKILNYLGEVVINGPSTDFFTSEKPRKIDIIIKGQFDNFVKTCRDVEPVNEKLSEVVTDPKERYLLKEKPVKGLRGILKSLGTREFIDDVRRSKNIFLMDTTFRDAHQSLLGSRVRTYDLKKISPFVENKLHNLLRIGNVGRRNTPHLSQVSE